MIVVMAVFSSLYPYSNDRKGYMVVACFSIVISGYLALIFSSLSAKLVFGLDKRSEMEGVQ